MATYQRLGLSLGRGGWVGCAMDDEAPFYMRFALTDRGRLVPVELHLAPGTGNWADLLRRLPLAEVEVDVNSGEVRERLLEWLHDPAPDPRADLAAMLPKSRRRAPVRQVKTAVIVVPDSGKGPYPDQFYKGVARLYQRLARETRRPAVVIAEANSVPLTTVHRWIKEARRRGHLPPGQKGRRG